MQGIELQRTADLDGRLELEQDGLVDEDLARLGAEELDLVLLQLNLLPWAVAANCRRAREGLATAHNTRPECRAIPKRARAIAGAPFRCRRMVQYTSCYSEGGVACNPVVSTLPSRVEASVLGAPATAGERSLAPTALLLLVEHPTVSRRPLPNAYASSDDTARETTAPNRSSCRPGRVTNARG